MGHSILLSDDLFVSHNQRSILWLWFKKHVKITYDISDTSVSKEYSIALWDSACDILRNVLYLDLCCAYLPHFDFKLGVDLKHFLS